MQLEQAFCVFKEKLPLQTALELALLLVHNSQISALQVARLLETTITPTSTLIRLLKHDQYELVADVLRCFQELADCHKNYAAPFVEKAMGMLEQDRDTKEFLQLLAVCFRSGQQLRDLSFNLPALWLEGMRVIEDRRLTTFCICILKQCSITLLQVLGCLLRDAESSFSAALQLAEMYERLGLLEEDLTRWLQSLGKLKCADALEVLFHKTLCLPDIPVEGKRVFVYCVLLLWHKHPTNVVEISVLLGRLLST